MLVRIVLFVKPRHIKAFKFSTSMISSLILHYHLKNYICYGLLRKHPLILIKPYWK